ncbi:nickel/cobalt transporter [Photobacterium leiognathi]|uniref:nickel/cobalt transporter n=1 Tax=Photobacterium leiognathi TaxID=553611 RepID=UPI002981CD3D|nr:nickel/cobalt transporter [Photobacterium leiognathi]
MDHQHTEHHHHHDKAPKNYWLGASLVLAFLAIGGYFLWQYWPTLMINTIKWQREINGQLSDLIYDAKDHNGAIYSLAGLSFLYGVFHSLGPGHGKMIVTTYLATNPAKVKASLIMTVVSAFLQAFVAIALVSILLAFFNSSMREINSAADRFITLSFVAMLLLGVIVAYRALKQAWQLIKQQKHHHAHSHSHSHSHDCGCGHKHFANADEINQATSMREYLAIIASIGIRPCTGAVLVLLFANMVDMYWIGVVSAILMAIGTAITTSTIAIMTLSGKKLVTKYLSASDDHQPSFTPLAFKLLGGILLIVLGTILLNSQSYGMSPVL